MTLKWDLPSGVTVSALRYPVPETLLISGLMNYVYEDDYAPLVTLTVPPNFAAGDRLPIRERADWLSCTHEICVPEGDDLSLDLERKSVVKGKRVSVRVDLGVRRFIHKKNVLIHE